MASNSTEHTRRSRALAESSQQAEMNSWLLPLQCQSSRTKKTRTRGDPGADKHASPTRLPPLLQPRRKEQDSNQRLKCGASKPSVRDSPSRTGLSSPPAWSEMDFHRAHPSNDKAELNLQSRCEKADSFLQRRSGRKASSGTRLQPLQHSALTRLEPLQRSAPQLPSLHHQNFVANVYSRGSSVFGSHFAACSASTSSAHTRSHSLGGGNSARLQIDTESDAQVMASTSVPSEISSKLNEDRNGDSNLVQVGIGCDDQEHVAKQQAVSEMHRLFAEEGARGGSPTGNAVKALRRLAEAGKKHDPEVSQRSRSCPCSVSAQSSRATSQRTPPAPIAVQPACH